MPDPVTPVSTTTTPVAQPMVATPGVAPIDPIAVQTTPAGGSSKGMMWVIVAAFVVVAVLVGLGIYMYMMARETNPAFQQVSQSVQQSFDSAASDLTGVQADEDVSKDFADVDKDLNNL